MYKKPRRLPLLSLEGCKGEDGAEAFKGRLLVQLLLLVWYIRYYFQFPPLDVLTALVVRLC